MIELLLLRLVFAEAVLLLAVTVKTGLQRPALTALDRLKQGKGPAIVSISEGILFVAFIYSVYGILRIRYSLTRVDSVTPIDDELLLAEKLLQASLVGFLLFLPLVMERVHHLTRAQGLLEEIIDAEEKKLRKRQYLIAEQLNALKSEIRDSKVKIKKLELVCQAKTNKAKEAEAFFLTLKDQAEGFHQQYYILMEYNQTLKNQLQSIDQGLLKDTEEARWADLKSNVFPWGIRTPNNNGAELGCEHEDATTTQCHQVLFCSSHATSSPRHRRPIYQH